MSLILAQVLPILLSLSGVEAPPSGSALYRERCAVCHGPQGAGLPGVVPPLAASDYLKADPRRAIRTLLKGLSGPIMVNGQRYDSLMPAHDTLTDAQAAAVLTFVSTAWNNGLPAVTSADVAAVRAETAGEPDLGR